MTRPKRFRDMGLSEHEVNQAIDDYVWDTVHLRSYSDAEYERFESRAKRLLPLWRAAGLKALQESVTCRECSGFGSVSWDTPLEACPQCYGKGTVRPLPWRSLKDDPPPSPSRRVIVRRSTGYQGTLPAGSHLRFAHKLLDTDIEKALSHGWREWCEVPS